MFNFLSKLQQLYMNQPFYKLSEQLGLACHKLEKTITVAESCTGGGISTAITDVAGSSAWFSSGFVVYSNEMKQKVLGVDAQTLAQHGAVSEPVVEQMLQGAIRVSGADLGVAVSGIAGPGGATPQKPLGYVCFAVGGSSSIHTFSAQFDGDRAQVRGQAVRKALESLLVIT